MIKPKLPKLTQKQQNKSILARQNFFDKQVKMEEWKNSMAGQNEVKVIKILNSLDFILGRDFVRQHPIGERFVIDIAFIKEKVAIEVDGKSHENKKQKTLDKMRDKFLRDNDWIPLRISDKEMFGYKKLYHKYIMSFIPIYQYATNNNISIQTAYRWIREGKIKKEDIKIEEVLVKRMRIKNKAKSVIMK